MGLIRTPWTQQPQLPTGVAAKFLNYKPTFVAVPSRRSLDLASNRALTAVGGTTVAGGAFTFDGVDDQIDAAAGVLSAHNAWTVVAIAQQTVFNNIYPFLFGWDTASAGATRRALAMSSDDAYNDIGIGSVAGTQTARQFFLPTGTTTQRHQYVFQARGSANGDLYCWADGLVLSEASLNLFGAVPTGNTIGHNTPTPAANNRWVGRIELVVLFDSILPEALCQELSINPWQIFAPVQRQLWVPDAAVGGTFKPQFSNQSGVVIGAGVI